MPEKSRNFFLFEWGRSALKILSKVVFYIHGNPGVAKSVCVKDISFSKYSDFMYWKLDANGTNSPSMAQWCLCSTLNLTKARYALRISSLPGDRQMSFFLAAVTKKIRPSDEPFCSPNSPIGKYIQLV